MSYKPRWQIGDKITPRCAYCKKEPQCGRIPNTHMMENVVISRVLKNCVVINGNIDGRAYREIAIDLNCMMLERDNNGIQT